MQDEGQCVNTYYEVWPVTMATTTGTGFVTPEDGEGKGTLVSEEECKCKQDEFSYKQQYKQYPFKKKKKAF